MSDRSSSARPSELRLILVLGILAAIGPLSIDMYLPSFPEIARTLGVSVASVQLSLSSYLAGLAAGQLFYGPLADRFGRRRPLLAGLGLYLAGSVLCALAPSLEVLVTARFVQALGGCAGMVISRAIVRDLFDPQASARLFSSLMLVMGAAPILAPLLGGQLLLVFGWRSVFVTLTLAAAAIIAVIFVGLPESLTAESRSRERPRQLARTLLTVLRDRAFLRATFAGAGMQSAMFAYIAGSPFVFIELFGVPEQQYGFLFGANALGLIGASQLNRFLVPRFGMQRLLSASIAISAASYVVLFVAAVNGAGLAVLLPAMFFGIACVGIAMPNATAVAMAPFPAQAGMASALLGTLQTACGAFASAATSALADGTARPMAGVMLACALMSLVLIFPVPRTRSIPIGATRQ